MQVKTVVAAVAAAMLMAVAQPAQAVVRYAITDLGTLGGPRSYARAINDHGQIVGESNTGIATYAFRWEQGTMVGLDTSGSNSVAYDINNAGVVVGYSGGNNNPAACFWYGGTRTALEKLRSYWYNSVAYCINDYGQIVGGPTIWDNGNVDFAFGYSYSTGSYGDARAINDYGQIVGFGGPLIPNAPSWSYGVNNLGQIVGYTADANGYKTPASTFAPLTTLPGGSNGCAFALNELGFIVGSSETIEGNLHATIWSPTADYTPLDLNALIPEDSGWAYLAEAYDINESGQIVGYGRLTGSNFDRAFLLTPIPEPATLSLLALGSLAILMKKVR